MRLALGTLFFVMSSAFTTSSRLKPSSVNVRMSASKLSPLLLGPAGAPPDPWGSGGGGVGRGRVAWEGMGRGWAGRGGGGTAGAAAVAPRAGGDVCWRKEKRKGEKELIMKIMKIMKIIILQKVHRGRRKLASPLNI